MAQTKFNMIENIVEILEKFWFLMSKGFSSPFQAFDWGEKGQKMNEKTEKSLWKKYLIHQGDNNLS